jgi:putative endonuclease
MYFLYILYSVNIDKYYIGVSENPISRLEKHNEERNNGWTKRGQPWKILKTFQFENKTIALKAEKKIKNIKSRKLIEDLIAGKNFNFIDF